MVSGAPDGSQPNLAARNMEEEKRERAEGEAVLYRQSVGSQALACPPDQLTGGLAR